MTDPVRLPDAASLETVLTGRDPASADAELVPALTAAFQGFEFSVAPIDDDYWRDTRSVICPDGTRLGELRPWMMAELAQENGDASAVWKRLKETDLQITEWRGTSAFVSAPTGPGVADYVQIALGREIEWRAGRIVNPDYRPWSEEELLDPSWPRTDQLPDSDRLAPVRSIASSAAPAGRWSTSAVFSTAATASSVASGRPNGPSWNGGSFARFGRAERARRRSWRRFRTISALCRESCGSFRTGRNRAPGRSASLPTGHSISGITPTRTSARSASFPGRCGRRKNICS